MEETNPEQDIQAPNRYTIQVCQRMRAAAVAPETVAQVYRPDGSFIAGLTLRRLKYLKDAYENHSGLPALADLLPGTFEEELARLLLRNSPRALKRDSTAQQASMPSAPSTLLSALRTGLGVTKERNVSPLAVHFDTEAFWSSNSRDQLFGASHQEEGTKWTGASLANPPPLATEMDKCLRWAIAASLEEEATLAILLLPETTLAGYARWLGHSNVRIMDTLKPEESLAMPADYWYGETTNSKKKAQNIMVIAIGNPQGLERYMREEHLKSAYASLLNREPHPRQATVPDVPRQGPINLDAIAFKIPRKFELAPVEQACQIPSRNKGPGNAQAPAEAPAKPTLRQQYPDVHRMKHEDQRTHLYTDGSCLEGPPQRIGAAVYQPLTGITHLVDPCGKGPTNTINRAELSGIYAALQHVALTHEDVTVFTDSLCALQQIRAAIHKPSSIADRKHRKLLSLIVDNLITRAEAGAHTTLAKVRAHHGLAGNEAADAGAKRAAQGERPNFSITEGNDPYADKYWPTHLAYTDPTHAQQSAVGQRPLPEQLQPADLNAALHGGTVARRPVNNMFKSLRIVIHPQHRLGFSNRTQYVEFWEQTREASLGDISNAMWNSPDVPFQAILNILKYRYGVLWNKKIAHRFGSPYLIGLDTQPAKNWACPLCGEEDSGGHILGGCKNAEIAGVKILR
jgi:ribonuclease HI